MFLNNKINLYVSDECCFCTMFTRPVKLYFILVECNNNYDQCQDRFEKACFWAAEVPAFSAFKLLSTHALDSFFELGNL